VGLLRGGLPAAIAFVQDMLVPRMLREGCAVDVALVPDLLPVLPCLKLCEAKDRCGCVGVHATGDLQTNGLRNMGARGHAVAIAQKMVFLRGQVVENQRSVQRMARRDRTPHMFVLADLFLLYDNKIKKSL
jgi:hypothetical protein